MFQMNKGKLEVLENSLQRTTKIVYNEQRNLSHVYFGTSHVYNEHHVKAAFQHILSGRMDI